MNAPEESTVARIVAGRLFGAGVRRVYGVPGEDHLLLLHELELSGIDYVSARDESAAALMAAAEAQATGVPAVVVTTLAPGVTNALNGVASAFLDHLPLIVISGQHDPDRYSTIVRQGLDSQAILRPLVKWSAVAGRRINQLMAKVLDVAMAPPQGPVFLELRAGVAAAVAADNEQEWPALIGGANSYDVAAVSPPAVAALRAELEQASQPVIIVGGRAAALSPEALGALAEAYRTPVFTSPSAKGALTEVHPFFAGVFVNGNLEATMLERADRVLAIGLDAYDYFNVPWRYGAQITALEAERGAGDHFLPVRSEVVGDPAQVLAGLLASAPVPKSAWSEDDVRDYRRHVRDVFSVDEEALTIPTGIIEARDVLPPETLVAVDAGFGKSIHSLLWSATMPNSCLSAQGLSTMGCTIPAATALKLAFPDRPAVGFMGDGSLLMRASEIGVASNRDIAPIYVVWVDSSLSQIEIKQRRQHLRTVGVDLGALSCEAIANAFGAVGFDVQSRSELRAALSHGLESRVPTLIGVRVDQTRRENWFEQLRG